MIKIDGAGEAYLNVGRGENGYGRLDVESGFVQVISTTNDNAGANIGSQDAIGALNLRNSSLAIASAHDAYLNIGQGGDALVDLSANSFIGSQAPLRPARAEPLRCWAPKAAVH